MKNKPNRQPVVQYVTDPVTQMQIALPVNRAGRRMVAAQQRREASRRRAAFARWHQRVIGHDILAKVAVNTHRKMGEFV